MENRSLPAKLKRIVLVGHALMLAAFAMLAMLGESVSGWPALVLGLAWTLVSLTCWQISLHRTVTPVMHLMAKLTAANERLAEGHAVRPLSGEYDAPFDRLVESHARMLIGVAMRQHELRSEFERLSAVLNGMGEGVIAIDRDEKILLANSTSRQMIPFVTENVAGRPFLEASRNWDLCEALRKCLATGRMQKREFKTTSEPIRTLALHASCLPGQPAPGAVVVLHDVSELRRLENLRHEFVANVSHELKTPLAAIMAYAETLRMGALNDQDNNLDFVCRIEEQAERLHQLIQDILQIARVESGQAVFEMLTLPLHELAQATVAQHTSAAARKQLALTLKIETPANVLADEDGLHTILDNLVSNAVKYTPSGGAIEVRVSVAAGQAVVQVEDNGIGISPEHLPRVFERFFRADRARARSVLGTGLGLSIVKHLVQAFGGTVSVSSRLGEGSCFEVMFPLADHHHKREIP